MNYTGKVIGDMEILEYVGYRHNHSYYKVRCKACELVREVSISNLLKQGSRHCYRTCGKQYLEHEYLNRCFGDYEVVDILPHNILVSRCKVCGKKITCIEQNMKDRYHSIKICQDDYFDNLINKTFGDFKVVGYAEKKHSTNCHYLKVECLKCGRQRQLKTNALFSQVITHKDCIKLVPKDKYFQIISERFQNIIQRTSNANNTHYEYYGGRGISCQFDHLIDFYDYIREDFVKSAELHGLKNISIDRIDNDGDYAKGNIRLTTRTVQQSNTRRNKHFVAIKDGEVVLANNAMAFGRHFNINGRSIGNALRKGRKEFKGWMFTPISPKDVEKILNNGSVTTNLLK